MINKENDKKEVPESNENPGPVDIATRDVQCHIVIKDKDTGEDLLNKRG